jgi:hypothetical protein
MVNSALESSDQTERGGLEHASAVKRCRREIAEIEAQLRSGHPDLAGLCQALADWSAELRLTRRQID